MLIVKIVYFGIIGAMFFFLIWLIIKTSVQIDRDRKWRKDDNISSK